MRIWLLGVVLVAACTSPSEPYKLALPEYVESFQIPENNPLSAAKVELGRHLFYENALSLDSSVSCASCHIQQFGFADTSRVSRGFKSDTGFRNATGLTNVAFQSSFFRDGGVTTLERAVHPPVLTEFEMNMDVVAMQARLTANPVYVSLFKEAFDTAVNYRDIVRALASFQRTLVSFNAPYDRYLQGDKNALSESQKRGLKLFNSDELNCTACHKDPLFLDEDMHNIGLYETYEDYGRGRVTLSNADFGRFRTPTLRNVAATYPYMHDGRLQTLQDVILFYEMGGVGHANRSEQMQPFTLTAQQRADLVAFLNSLTDAEFLSNPALARPIK